MPEIRSPPLAESSIRLKATPDKSRSNNRTYLDARENKERTMIGKTISHYRIVEKIGQGGMGEVYLAEDTALDRKVALKFRPEAFTSDPSRSPFRVSLPDSKPGQVFKFKGRKFSLDDWSPAGSHLLYHDANQPELWAVSLSEDQEHVRVAQELSGFVDQAQFSPDGRWIAYNTNETSRHEVKVVPFPPADDKWPISTDGGVQPTWSNDGHELYFLAPDGTLMAVEINPGAKFEPGMPHQLFETGISVSPQVEQYAPHPDGKRFLSLKPSEQSAVFQFNVILNWTSLLEQ